MKKHIYRNFVTFVLLCSLAIPVYPWGSAAHKQITKDAIPQLPADVAPFFQEYADSVVAHCTDPDTRKREQPEERPRHYIDIDHYGTYPYDQLPHEWDAAVAKFSVDTLIEYGTLPWWIDRTTDSLAQAMRNKNPDKIIHWAAFLAHYVGDAHQPLHTVMNYDGQLSGNDGIHSRYETGMLRIYLNQYHYKHIKAPPINHPLGEAFDIILESNQLAPEIFKADDNAIKGMSSQAIEQLQDYWKVDRDSVYFAHLFNQVRQMTWHQLDLASSRLAAYYTAAWIKAGKPALAAAATP